MKLASTRNAVKSNPRPEGGTDGPRMIFVDDNIRDQGGHYFELASMLLTGAEQLGYRCVLATHRDFALSSTLASNWESRHWEIHPVFGTRRLVRWSLGVDGHSRLQRDLSGNPMGGSPIENLATRTSDWLRPASQRPNRMLQRWADDLCRLIEDVRPTAQDSLLVNTGDDFALLALANAMKQSKLPRMRLDVLLHFAIHETGQTDRMSRMRRLGRQLRAALDGLKPHQVYLHATTDELAEQFRQLEGGFTVRSVPYPTRSCDVVPGSVGEPLTAIIAGMPRAEKGKDAIHDLLAGIEESLIKSGRYQLSMQLPPDRWRSMLPSTLLRSCEVSLPGESMRPLEIITQHLSTQDYHRWLGMADLGLFLYDPNRYTARCSGVLLEMMARGVPVIVPDHCWLASQVRLAGGHRSIGLIYQDRSEIPDLMRQFVGLRQEIHARSKAYSATIRQRHDGRNTLLEMGIPAVTQDRVTQDRVTQDRVTQDRSAA